MAASFKGIYRDSLGFMRKVRNNKLAKPKRKYYPHDDVRGWHEFKVAKLLFKYQ